MTRLEALKELAEKVEAGETWRLSRASHFVPLGDPDCLNWALRAFGGSLDAALALHEAVLPGWGWRVAWCNVSDDSFVFAPDDSMAPDGREWSDYTDIDQRPSGNPARAWLLSILKALIAQEVVDIVRNRMVARLESAADDLRKLRLDHSE